MSQPIIIVEGINCRNEQDLRDLLDRRGFHSCYSWINDISLKIGFLPEAYENLIVAIEDIGLKATHFETNQ